MCFLWVCVHVAVVVCLFSHFPLFVSHVCGFTDSRAHLTRARAWLRPMQTCGWRLWLRKEGKKEGGEETRGRECIGGGGKGCRKRAKWRVSEMKCLLPFSLGCRFEQLAMNRWVAASLSTPRVHTDTYRHSGAAENSQTEAFHNIC